MLCRAALDGNRGVRTVDEWVKIATQACLSTYKPLKHFEVIPGTWNLRDFIKPYLDKNFKNFCRAHHFKFERLASGE